MRLLRIDEQIKLDYFFSLPECGLQTASAKRYWQPIRTADLTGAVAKGGWQSRSHLVY